MLTRTGKDIIGIAIHCSAGYGDLASMRKFWRTLGWKSDGYHLLVDLDGTVIEVTPFQLPSNGVKGHNAQWIHICYRGGVERNNPTKAVDTRNILQKEGLIKAINKALQWIQDTGGNVAPIVIKGHRDFSPDLNGNGIIDSWERIKECPSFNAIPEYNTLVKEFIRRNPVKESKDVEYTVRSGDTLTKISAYNNVSVQRIKELNCLTTDMIHIGQRLKIK